MNEGSLTLYVMKISIIKNEMKTSRLYKQARMILGVMPSLSGGGGAATAREAGGGERELQFKVISSSFINGALKGMLFASGFEEAVLTALSRVHPLGLSTESHHIAFELCVAIRMRLQ